MKAYHTEAMGAVVPTYIGVGSMLSNTGNNYLIVALVHGLTIAGIASVILFSKSNVIHCSSAHLEDSASWSQDKVLATIPAFFLDTGLRAALFLNQQVSALLDRSSDWWGMEQVSRRSAFA